MWVWLALALAAECKPPEAPPGRLSVAWVAPLGSRSTGGKWLPVVPVGALGEALGNKGTVGQMLRELGLRKRDGEPKRRYQVVVFDIDGSAVCRPLADAEPWSTDGGVLVCAARHSTGRQPDGCGRVVDRADGKNPLPLYRIRWRDAARRGFCLLPADRFAAGEGAP